MVSAHLHLWTKRGSSRFNEFLYRLRCGAMVGQESFWNTDLLDIDENVKDLKIKILRCNLKVAKTTLQRFGTRKMRHTKSPLLLGATLVVLVASLASSGTRVFFWIYLAPNRRRSIGGFLLCREWVQINHQWPAPNSLANLLQST